MGDENVSTKNFFSVPLPVQTIFSGGIFLPTVASNLFGLFCFCKTTFSEFVYQPPPPPPPPPTPPALKNNGPYANTNKRALFVSSYRAPARLDSYNRSYYNTFLNLQRGCQFRVIKYSHQIKKAHTARSSSQRPKLKQRIGLSRKSNFREKAPAQ